MKNIQQESPGKSTHKDRYDMTGFLVIKDITFKPNIHWDERGYIVNTEPFAASEPFLYVEGLCSNARGGGAKLLDLVNIMGFDMGFVGTKLAALTMVISYYFAKFNFRHYQQSKFSQQHPSLKTVSFPTNIRSYIETMERNSLEYPKPCGKDKNWGQAWDQYLMKFMTQDRLKQLWKEQSKQEVDIEHFHRDQSSGIWLGMIGTTGMAGEYPHLNAGSTWQRRSPRLLSEDTDMGDMGYYMYFLYGTRVVDSWQDASRYTPTTKYIMKIADIGTPELAPGHHIEGCCEKVGKVCKTWCPWSSKYKKEGGKRSRRKRKRKTRKRKRKRKRKYRRKRTRKRKKTRKIN